MCIEILYIGMQQYYELDGSGVLTVFHRPDSVSFNKEHTGGASVDRFDKLRDLYDGSLEQIKVKEFEIVLELTKLDSGGLEVYIESVTDNTTVELSSDQFDTIIDCLGSGTEDVGYDVESVDRDGNRS